MKKNQYKELFGLCPTDIDHQGRGVAEQNGKRVLIENTLPGELVDAKIVKKDRGAFIARPTKFHRQATSRILKKCQHFGVCGGCKWQSVDYTAQLGFKARFVQQAFSTLPQGSYPTILPIIGSDNVYHYRNKMEFSFGNKRWLIPSEMQDGPMDHMDALGLHPAGAFDKVLDLKECYLQPEPSDSIRLWVKQFCESNGYSFFDLRNQEGFLRNLTIRTTQAGHTMVILSLFKDDETLRNQLLDGLIAAFPALASVNYVINPGKNDTIYDYEVINYYGTPHITEQLGYVSFKIGPKSFFQVNVPQAKRLYDIALQFAGLTGTETVFDLYTGIGSIALYVANKCKSITGIESVLEAIDDAKENARLNNITNCNFVAGDMREILTADYLSSHAKPDLIITDPPRAGMHPQVVQAILHAGAPRIVYVSCNPISQARDLLPLLEKYSITAVQPVDMFPQTYHIECVVQLDLKQ